MYKKKIKSNGLSLYAPCVNDVVAKGKSAYVKKPPCSSCCGATLWGHGWRERWADDTLISVWRLICSACRKTFTLLPKGLWIKFQALAQNIVAAVHLRLEHCRWGPNYTRQRIRWWVRVALQRLKSAADLLHDAALCDSSLPAFTRCWLPHPSVS